MKASSLASFVVAAGLLVTAPSALGQTRSRFDDQYRQANELRARHDDAGALQVFESIWATSHEPRARAQIGLAEAALGRWVVAEAHLVEALSASADHWIARNRAIIESTLGTVRSRLGSLEVICPSPGAEVWMGDHRVASLPLSQPIRLAAGTIQFELRAPGRAPSAHTAVIPANGLARETLEDLARVTPDPPASGAPVPQRPGWVAGEAAPPQAAPASGGILRSPWFWAAVGVVVAGGVTTGVVLATRNSEEPYTGNLSPGMVTVR